ncbi:hypothetical protein ACFQ8S_32575 [Streptomyces virginiae]|uniref:hypothetical protein n=1 Tax=Streptomyces virginiae TaxID=1961 RepID=UPI0036CE5809
MRERKQLNSRAQITSALPEDHPAGPVSVAGDFNHHTAQASLPAHSSHSFRYLAAGDYWFNDDSADHHDGTNSRIPT